MEPDSDLKSRGPQFTSVCFTWNNWDTNVKAMLIALVPNFFSYLLLGEEVGKEGTPHLQAYGELTKRTEYNTLRKVLQERHFERRRGTQAQAIRYIINEPSKPNPVYTEHGIKKAQGSRNDLPRIANIALTEGMRELACVATSLQQLKHGEAVLTYLEDKRDWKPEVVWIYGPSGSGKSKLANEMAHEAGDWFLKKSSNGKWFSGYDGHRTLWIDDVKADFFGSECNTYAYLLDILDRYPCTLETKGGQRQLLARLIIITSLNHPTMIFDDNSKELTRRIDKYVKL